MLFFIRSKATALSSLSEPILSPLTPIDLCILSSSACPTLPILFTSSALSVPTILLYLFSASCLILLSSADFLRASSLLVLLPMGFPLMVSSFLLATFIGSSSSEYEVREEYSSSSSSRFFLISISFSLAFICACDAICYLLLFFGFCVPRCVSPYDFVVQSCVHRICYLPVVVQFIHIAQLG